MALLTAALLMASGCQPSDPATPSPSVTSSPTPSPSIPSIDPTRPGLAPQIVAELAQQADGAPIVRVQIDHRQVTLTYVDRTSRPVTLVWTDGQVTEVDEGSDFAVSASFDPTGFNLEKVAEMFVTAYDIAGTDSRQQLQITEYSNGQVLMTVTTNPESTTVFFRPDGSVIKPLNYANAEGIGEGLLAAADGSTAVLGVGISEQQIWVEVTGPQAGTIERRIRPATVPIFKSARSQSTTDLNFALDRVDPAVVSRLFDQLPTELGKPKAAVSVVIKHEVDAPEPRMIFDVAGTKVTTDLAGNRLPIGQR